MSSSVVVSQKSLSPTPSASNDKLSFGDKIQSTNLSVNVNVFTPWAANFSTRLAYEMQVRYHYNPYPHLLCAYRIRIKVSNLAFERIAHLANDLLVLFSYVSKEIIPMHASDKYPWASSLPKYFVRFIGFDKECDREMVENPKANSFAFKPNQRRPLKEIPAKERYIVVETNYEFLPELLADPRLFILADHSCFHMCWDGKLVKSHECAEGEESPMIQHNVNAMKKTCDDIWEYSGLRERHRKTGGLPCTSMKFITLNFLEIPKVPAVMQV